MVAQTKRLNHFFQFLFSSRCESEKSCQYNRSPGDDL